MDFDQLDTIVNENRTFIQQVLVFVGSVSLFLIISALAVSVFKLHPKEDQTTAADSPLSAASVPR
ncbi:XcGVORF54-like protein [Hyphantria cunea granulovirus]|uniref:XcGVORF54-like protein n=1 Tax=Hyphantria cunea granulovirus TaxID=307448 RepID=A0AAE5YIV4_9BBAC|nr:XcGVORF54-like protein [Hyphantria cunea granulovirus]QBQ01598.1 XcGVORF54-like protein [Hyphantria cunea granulovirus]